MTRAAEWRGGVVDDVGNGRGLNEAERAAPLVGRVNLLEIASMPAGFVLRAVMSINPPPGRPLDEVIDPGRLEGIVAQFGGHLSGATSGPKLASYGTAEQAVLCSIAILEATHSVAGSDAAGNTGIGVHIGQVTADNLQPLARTVDVVTALGVRARSGTACLSRVAYEAVLGKTDAVFSEGGEFIPAGQSRAIRCMIMTHPAQEVVPSAAPEPISPAHGRTVSDEPTDGSSDDETFLWVGAESGSAKHGTTDAILATTRLKEREAAAEAHATRGEVYAALQCLDEALTEATRQSATREFAARLEARRAGLVATLGFAGDAVIEGERRIWSLLVGDAKSIGRSGGKEHVDVSVGCRLVSRAGRPVRIVRTTGGYAVENHGSTNSVFVGDSVLPAGRTLTLASPEGRAVLSLGGVADPPRKGDCRFELMLIGDPDPILSLRVDLGHLGGAVEGRLAETWPAWREDSRRTWLMMSRQLLIGAGAECGMRLDGADAHGALAAIDLRGGRFHFKALGPGASIDGVRPAAAIPIRDGAELALAGARFSFRSK
jgi:hypothetical protein